MACTSCGWRKDITSKESIYQYCQLCGNRMKICGRVEENKDKSSNPFYTGSSGENLER